MLSVFSKILDGSSLCECFIESSDIWIVYFLVDLRLPLVNCSRRAISCVWTQEEQRFAGVESGFKIAMLCLGMQQVIVETG